MTLNDLKQGEKGIIVKVRGRGAFRKRITEMGFVKGKEVLVVKSAPLKDPVEFLIMSYNVSLRRSEASLIDVITPDEAIKEVGNSEFSTHTPEEIIKTKAREKGHTINIALVGNPNSGKTTLFNYSSGAKEHVGNYSGVTVDSKTAKFVQHNYTFNITDLPGTYSISAFSPEELYVRKYITENHPDVIINIVDASNLERNLFLTTQLIDMDVKVVVALNMYDELEETGADFDYNLLGKMLGIPFVPTVASKGKGVHQLFDKVIKVFEDKDVDTRHIHIYYGFEVEKAIVEIQKVLKQDKVLTDKFSSRYLAIKLLEKDKDVDKLLSTYNEYTQIKDVASKAIAEVELAYKEDSETIITDSKYGFITGALKETFKKGNYKNLSSDKIDKIVTNKYLGFPLFLLFLALMFFTTFQLGEYPKNWLQYGVNQLGHLVDLYVPSGTFNDLLTDGIINGVGGVLVFLPNILILFLFISFMEDTGYMARVAFIMDKLMHNIGLHGKSFIPMIMGFGCTVPAIMSTRTIENRNDRILTMLITPFMSCSARLPVYVLIISAFFPNYPTLVLLCIYLSGILLSIIFAVIFKRTLFKSKEAPFVMELPPYRMPTFRSTIKHMWGKGSQYLKKIGGVILVASIIIWTLEYFPKNIDYSINYDNLISEKKAEILNASDKNKSDIIILNNSIDSLNSAKQRDHLQKSYIGRIGLFIEPVMRPIGFDWKMSVSVLTGIAGKEIVVSTMSILYQSETPKGEPLQSLQDKIKTEKYTSGPSKGKAVFNPVVAISFLMFILIYFPCIAVVVAIRKESEKLKWSIFTVVYTTLTAWVVAFLIYNIGSLILF